MAESLRDQLLKAGLAKAVPKSKAKPKAKVRARKSATSGRNSKPNKPPSSDLAKAWQARSHAEKTEAEKKRQQKRAEQQKKRETNNKIHALLEKARLNKEDADLSRNFFHFGKIRKVMVDAEQLAKLNAGELAIVYLRGRYALVEAQVAAAVTKLSPQHVPDLSGSDDETEIEHPVPDDLVW